jgi:hypothetical protein
MRLEIDGNVVDDANVEATLRQLAERIERLERIVRELAQATKDWEGGANEGAVYTHWTWRQSIADAVKELSGPGGTRTHDPAVMSRAL